MNLQNKILKMVLYILWKHHGQLSIMVNELFADHKYHWLIIGRPQLQAEGEICQAVGAA